MADLGLPMQGGFLNEIPPNASLEIQIATLNGVIRRLNEVLKGQIFSDGTNKRMIIGFQKDGWGPGKDFGIKISIEGSDVTTATDQQLLFKMDLKTWSFYDPTTHKNFMQFGVMPDGTGGITVVESGYNVLDVY